MDASNPGYGGGTYGSPLEYVGVVELPSTLASLGSSQAARTSTKRGEPNDYGGGSVTTVHCGATDGGDHNPKRATR